jgi:hypothetical protein
MRDPASPSGQPFSRQVFNNADSFAQAFDEAWQQHQRSHPDHSLSTDAKVALILEQLQEHPFQHSDPERAAQVAAFRVRLLGL